MTHAPGFWSSFGAAASVDWCEPNYQWADWIAEGFNTLSSVPMFVVGLIALWRCYRADWRIDSRFVICFVGLTVVGAGSVAFHGTLLHVAQAFDELPMVYCSLVMAYCVVVRARDAQKDARLLRRWQLGFSLYAAAFTIAYLVSPNYFALFIVSFAGVVGYLVIQGWRVAFRVSGARDLGRLYKVAAGAFVCAVFVFWFPERLLPCDHMLQAIQLHACFHLLAMVGTYTGFLVVLYDRLDVLEQEPVVRWRGLPWVSPRR